MNHRVLALENASGKKEEKEEEEREEGKRRKSRKEKEEPLMILVCGVCLMNPAGTPHKKAG